MLIFFSLDAEGYEYAILPGIDFAKVSFDYLMIEIYKKDFDKIVGFLKSQGYTLRSCISNYGRRNKHWDKLHNDYIFYKK